MGYLERALQLHLFEVFEIFRDISHLYVLCCMWTLCTEYNVTKFFSETSNKCNWNARSKYPICLNAVKEDQRFEKSFRVLPHSARHFLERASRFWCTESRVLKSHVLTFSHTCQTKYIDVDFFRARTFVLTCITLLNHKPKLKFAKFDENFSKNDGLRRKARYFSISFLTSQRNHLWS